RASIPPAPSKLGLMAGGHAHGEGVDRGASARPALAARRAENRRRMILAAGVNALLFVAGVVGGLVTGSLALLADAGHVLSDLAATVILARGARDDLNLEAVLRHSAADVLGAAGVIVSGLVIVTTGWNTIDPIVGIAIAVLILVSSVRLVREPLDVLMEAAPT